ncbi:methyltransferase domain-containing protein [Candidatus Poribacteria bacterium]|nr:methyltransferase domain-containing protein [Candidatus Poribacteria bacterium]
MKIPHRIKTLILNYGDALKNRKSFIINVYYKLYTIYYKILDLFSNKKYVKNYFISHDIYKLQIGSGMNAIEGWLNTDINPRKGIIYLDAYKKLPFENNTFHYIFNEHFIEHLPYRMGEKMLKECYRILKPGGKIRISTPDLQFLIKLYGENKTQSQKEYIQWAADIMFPDDLKGISEDTFVINNFFYNWEHKFIYDENSLTNLLISCGFINVLRYDIGESDDDNLRNLEHHGFIIGDKQNRIESMAFEATKPLVKLDR